MGTRGRSDIRSRAGVTRRIIWSKAAEALSTRPAKGVTFAGLRSANRGFLPVKRVVSGRVSADNAIHAALGCDYLGERDERSFG
jgi:hypothetical protein